MFCRRCQMQICCCKRVLCGDNFSFAPAKQQADLQRQNKPCSDESVPRFVAAKFVTNFVAAKLTCSLKASVLLFCGRTYAFFLACEDFGGRFDDSFPARVEISSSTQFHFLCQDQSTVAQRAETTVAECSLASCE